MRQAVDVTLDGNKTENGALSRADTINVAVVAVALANLEVKVAPVNLFAAQSYLCRSAHFAKRALLFDLAIWAF